MSSSRDITGIKDTALCFAAFMTAAVPETIEKLEAFHEARARLNQAMINQQRHTYADTPNLHFAIEACNDQEMRPIAFMRRIAEIDENSLPPHPAFDPNDRTGPMFLKAVRDFLKAFDSLPLRVQYVVVNLAPTQRDFSCLAEIAGVRAIDAIDSRTLQR